jgi:hypothetical protein
MRLAELLNHGAFLVVFTIGSGQLHDPQHIEKYPEGPLKSTALFFVA